MGYFSSEKMCFKLFLFLSAEGEDVSSIQRDLQTTSREDGLVFTYTARGTSKSQELGV